MRSLLAVLVLSGVALTGCAGATHTVRLDDPADANRQFAGRAVTLVLSDGALYPADAVRIARDSTSWIDPETGDYLATPTASIIEIRHRSRGRAVGRGAKRGAIGGAISGGVLLGIAGYDSGGCLIFCYGEPTQSDRVGAAAVFGVAGALLGAVEGTVVGLLVGALSDPTDRFLVERPRPTSPGEGPSETAASGEPSRAPSVASRPARSR